MKIIFRKIKNLLYQAKNLFIIAPKMNSFLRSAIYLASGKNPRRLQLRNGIEVLAPQSHPLIEIVSDIFIKKVYTPKNMEIGQNDIVIDIGANIGIFSLMAARKTKNKVYAFEPAKENIYYLKRNMKINNITNVVENEIAVSNQVEIKKLFLTQNPAGHVLYDYNVKKRGEFIEIPTTTLRTIIDNNHIEQVDFLKMDCEGSEGGITKTTPKEYLRKIKKISMEFHDNVSALNHIEIQEILNDAGFVTNLIWDGKSPFGYIYAYNPDG